MSETKKSYVYMIKCMPTSRIYIGKSNNPTARFQSHLQGSKNKKNYLPLYRAIRKYGFDAFELIVLHEYDTEQEAYDSERDTILRLRAEGASLFNRSAGGIGNFSPTSDTRKRMSKAQKGRIVSEEHREKISNSLAGRNLSAEHIEKMRTALSGQKRTKEQCDKLKAAAKKRSLNPEWREKNRIACQENAKKSGTPECREKISKAQRTYTDEQALMVQEAYSSGMPFSTILEQFSVSVGTFYRMLARANSLSVNAAIAFRHHKCKSKSE